MLSSPSLINGKVELFLFTVTLISLLSVKPAGVLADSLKTYVPTELSSGIPRSINSLVFVDTISNQVGKSDEKRTLSPFVFSTRKGISKVVNCSN